MRRKQPASSLPSLPSAFNFFYQELNESNKAIFIKVLRWLWGEILPIQCITGSAGLFYSFWVVDLVRGRYGLGVAELSLLSYLYQVTKQGRKHIKSDVVYNSIMWRSSVWLCTKVEVLAKFKHLGYVARSSRDPLASPHLQSSHAKQKVFISLTPLGVALIHSIEKDIYNLLMGSSLQDITGMKKP